MQPGRGTVCACADDIGLALMSVWSPPIVTEIFAHAEYLTSLKLKPTKCLPLVKFCTSAPFLVPWPVAYSGGPLPTSSGCTQRARDIANTSAPPVAAVSLYNLRAAVVIASVLKLSYNAFSLCGLLNLWQWGGWRVHSLLVTAFATPCCLQLLLLLVCLDILLLAIAYHVFWKRFGQKRQSPLGDWPSYIPMT